MSEASVQFPTRKNTLHEARKTEFYAYFGRTPQDASAPVDQKLLPLVNRLDRVYQVASRYEFLVDEYGFEWGDIVGSAAQGFLEHADYITASANPSARTDYAVSSAIRKLVRTIGTEIAPEKNIAVADFWRLKKDYAKWRDFEEFFSKHSAALPEMEDATKIEFDAFSTWLENEANVYIERLSGEDLDRGKVLELLSSKREIEQLAAKSANDTLSTKTKEAWRKRLVFLSRFVGKPKKMEHFVSIFGGEQVSHEDLDVPDTAVTGLPASPLEEVNVHEAQVKVTEVIDKLSQKGTLPLRTEVTLRLFYGIGGRNLKPEAIVATLAAEGKVPELLKDLPHEQRVTELTHAEDTLLYALETRPEEKWQQLTEFQEELLCFGVGLRNTELSQIAIGKLFDITPERVRQIVEKGKRMIRHELIFG